MINLAIRRPNLFEKILLVTGVLVIMLGYVFVHKLALVEGLLSWQSLQTIFLWFILIVLVILAAVNENMKEELKTVIQNQIDEIKLLRREIQYKK